MGKKVVISPHASIHTSKRGSVIAIGDFSEIYDFVCIRCVGGEGNIRIGPHCYINPHCVLYSGHGIYLGSYVLLAPGVKLMPTNHDFSKCHVPIRKQGFSPSKGGIIIEDDVWIGANSVVLDGASIGRGAVIGAGSVVRGKIPPFEVWGGVPARRLAKRIKTNIS